MATQPKKTNRRSSPRKKPVPKRKRTKTTKGSTFKKSIFIVLGVLFMISMVFFGYFLGRNDLADTQKPVAQTTKKDTIDRNKELLADLAKIKATQPRKKQETPVQKEPKVERNSATKPLLQQPEVNEVKELKKEEVPKAVIAKDRVSSETIPKPRLAIIIDDVSNRSQLNEIKATGLKLTPSIFPPSKLSSNSHELAEGLQHYMIHLPMESGSPQFNSQSKTLLTTSSEKEIEARVSELRALFPHAKYINNHTGSVFTDNYDAMQRLYGSLRQEGFVFVDSRTIASTKVPRISEAYGDTYIARDVFIDNLQTVPAIHQQLQKAVNIAKKKGHAIAIGHPHSTTMKALTTAKDIFQDVDIVYIDELYR